MVHERTGDLEYCILNSHQRINYIMIEFNISGSHGAMKKNYRDISLLLHKVQW